MRERAQPASCEVAARAGRSRRLRGGRGVCGELRGRGFLVARRTVSGGFQMFAHAGVAAQGMAAQGVTACAATIDARGGPPPLSGLIESRVRDHGALWLSSSG